jgi:hypothetical protein
MGMYSSSVVSPVADHRVGNDTKRRYMNDDPAGNLIGGDCPFIEEHTLGNDGRYGVIGGMLPTPS